MRSRLLSRSSANGEGRARLSRNEINAQGTGLRHRAFVELLLVVTSTGRKRRETPYRHVDTVKGKSGEASRSDDRKALSSLFASSRESSVTRIYYSVVRDACRRPPVFHSQPK